MPTMKNLKSSEYLADGSGPQLGLQGKFIPEPFACSTLISASARRADQHQLRSGWDDGEGAKALSATSSRFLSVVLLQLWIKEGQWRLESPSSLNGLDKSSQRTPLELITIREKGVQMWCHVRSGPHRCLLFCSDKIGELTRGVNDRT